MKSDDRLRREPAFDVADKARRKIDYFAYFGRCGHIVQIMIGTDGSGNSLRSYSLQLQRRRRI